MMKRLAMLASYCGLMTIFSIVALGDPCTEEGSMKRAFKRTSGNFEYVIFEFNKPADPKFDLRTERPPFYSDGAGDRVKVRGNFFKVAYFMGVPWTCDIVESLGTRTSAVIDVKNIGQFEGYITYAIGYRKRGSYVSNYVQNNGPKLRQYVIKFKK